MKQGSIKQLNPHINSSRLITIREYFNKPEYQYHIGLYHLFEYTDGFGLTDLLIANPTQDDLVGAIGTFEFQIRVTSIYRVSFIFNIRSCELEHVSYSADPNPFQNLRYLVDKNYIEDTNIPSYPSNIFNVFDELNSFLTMVNGHNHMIDW
jgi:hypothetical protein